jgi:hypothetical protein
LLSGPVRAFTRDVAGKGFTDWFFIRYSDPRRHIRLRFRGAAVASRAVVVELAAGINFSPSRRACPFLPTAMWSSTEMPSGVAMSMMAFVIWMSACDGVGLPEG